MDDNEKNVSSYQLDQEILDARGISMTVEEVAGLPACKYTERIRSLKLNAEDRSFLKGLRRRIKNRLASQNSRRRSMEHLRELTRELRALRVCRDYALCERDALMSERDSVREHCRELRSYVVQVLQDRSDPTEVPSIDVDRVELANESPPKDTTKTNDKPKIKSEIKSVDCPKIEPIDPPKIKHINPPKRKPINPPKIKTIEPPKIVTVKETKTPLLPECFAENEKNVFECRIDKLVQQSVNHLYKSDPERDKKRIFAKTVFITNDKTISECETVTPSTFVKTKTAVEKSKSACNSRLLVNSGKSIDERISADVTSLGGTSLKECAKSLDAAIKKETEELNACIKEEFNGIGTDEGTVLNLSLKKEGKRRSHGRKQSAPKRVAYVCMDTDDFVLDLKVKKENP